MELWWNFDAAYCPVGGSDWLPPPGIGIKYDVVNLIGHRIETSVFSIQT